MTDQPATEAGRTHAGYWPDHLADVLDIEAEAAEPYRRVVEAALDHSCGAQCNRGDAMHSVDHNLAEALRAALPVVVKDEDDFAATFPHMSGQSEAQRE